MFLDILIKLFDNGFIKHVLISAILAMVVIIICLMFVGLVAEPLIVPGFVILTCIFTVILKQMQKEKSEKL